MSSPAPAIPEGVTPLVWAESTDERRNSRFEALSHVHRDAEGLFTWYWVIAPELEENRAWWKLSGTSVGLCDAALGDDREAFAALRYATSEEAQAACERWEAELGGAERAPRTPIENPDQAPPMVTDEHGFAPTRTIVARWSRRDGRLYLDRVWAKPDQPEVTVHKQLAGEEYEAALPGYLRQQMVQSLVGSITTPGGWIVPLVWTTEALGQVRMECEVHFANVRGLHWARALRPGTMSAQAKDFVELAGPSHADICRVVGETLQRRKAEFDKTLAKTSTQELQREIARNARALGINSPMPEAEQETGHVLPATLEHLQAAGMDLKGDALR